jgi:Tfp pilus assembly protein PilP
MKLGIGILILGMGLGVAGAQNPNIINSTRTQLNTVQQQQAANSNAALAAAQGQSASAQPATAGTKPTGGRLVSPAQAQPQKQPVATTAPAKAPKAAPSTAKLNSKPKQTTAVAVSKPKPPVVAVEDNKIPVDPKKDAHKATISMAGGRRDPFLSPVVNHTLGGSGCSTGKRCLAVDQIALTGIVKADGGMIAVVMNAMNKAYFLRENDPVFNGYVVRITGDSIVFKETLQDKLGKEFTREVTKKITTPAV